MPEPATLMYNGHTLLAGKVRSMTSERVYDTKGEELIYTRYIIELKTPPNALPPSQG